MTQAEQAKAKLAAAAINDNDDEDETHRQWDALKEGSIELGFDYGEKFILFFADGSSLGWTASFPEYTAEPAEITSANLRHYVRDALNSCDEYSEALEAELLAELDAHRKMVAGA